MDERPPPPLRLPPQPNSIHLPARVPSRPVGKPSVPSQTTIIPAVTKAYDRVKPAPLTQEAQRRGGRLAIIVVGIMAVVLACSVTSLSSRAQPLLPWNAQGHGAVYPTPTPSHPVAYGEHDFVCAALPFARLAQDKMTSGTNAQPHPWYISLILAQWGVEQGWTIPGYTGYNWGNSSALPGFPAVAGTNQPGSPGAFAYATSAEMGVAIYVDFVKNGLYDAVARAYPSGPQAQAVALGQSPWDAGHYTATGNPGSSLLATMQYYRLQRYDAPGATC
jgi:hypothetical protein